MVIHSRDLLELGILIVTEVEADIIERLAGLFVLLHLSGWEPVNELHHKWDKAAVSTCDETK